MANFGLQKRTKNLHEDTMIIIRPAWVNLYGRTYALIKNMFGHFPQILKFGRDVVQRHICRAQICKRLRSPGIDSEESIPPAYVAWRAGTSNMVIVGWLHRLG